MEHSLLINIDVKRIGCIYELILVMALFESSDLEDFQADSQSTQLYFLNTLDNKVIPAIAMGN